MKYNYNDFSDNARVWIYQADRLLSDAEATIITKEAGEFVATWSAHGEQLKATAAVFYNMFLVLFVDEDEQARASGCSIDTSLRFIQDLGKKHDINWLDRMNVAYKTDSDVTLVKLSVFRELAREKKLSADTIVFNNMITSLAEFRAKWEVPLRKSWHSQFITQ